MNKIYYYWAKNIQKNGPPLVLTDVRTQAPCVNIPEHIRESVKPAGFEARRVRLYLPEWRREGGECRIS